MAEVLLTDKEEGLVTQLKAYFYYLNNDSDLQSLIAREVRTVAKERRPYVVSSLLVELNYEQAQRRRYIEATLGISGLDKGEEELFIRNIARGKEADAAIKEINPKGSLRQQPTPEILQQAKIFDTVASQIELYFTEVVAEERIKGIFGLLKNASPQLKQALSNDISGFLEKLKDAFRSTSLDNIQVSPAIVEELESLGMGMYLSRLETLGERVQFINTVRSVADAQLANTQLATPLPDAELIRRVALWSYYQNPPSVLPEENEEAS